MAIMTRFFRIFKADLHGVMDQMEDKRLLLKQHLREMEEELNHKREELACRSTSRKVAEEEVLRCRTEEGRLRDDIIAALDRDKEEIARELVRRQLVLSRHLEEMERLQETEIREIDRLGEELEEQERQYERMRLQSAAFLRANEGREFPPWDRESSTVSDEEVELALIHFKEKGGTGS